MMHIDHPARRARGTLLAAVGAFAALQLGMWVLMDDWLPALHDPEYGYKLELLHRRLAERPNHALTVLIGSSRSDLGFDPESLPRQTLPDGREHLVFNFAVTGCGPVQELQMLRRLLRHGVRPERLLIEIHPLMLHQEDGFGEEMWIEPRRMDWRDLLLVKDYVFRPCHFVWRWCRCRLAPWYSNRFLILDRFARKWLDNRAPIHPWHALSDYGWLACATVTPEARRSQTDYAKREYAPMLNGYRVTEPADRALHNLLRLCAEKQIETALVILPEGSEFRACYTPATRGRFNDYMASLSRQFDVPVYDATEWCDDDDFWDSHHLLASGARHFSQRFGRQAWADFQARFPARSLR